MAQLDMARAHSNSLRVFIKAIRPHHWLKNGLVFVPILLAHDLFDYKNLLYGAIAFLALGLCASAIYLLNDLMDVESDRKHPTKCKRPLASGAMSARTAQLAVPCLVVAAFALTLLVPKPLLLVAVLAAYFGLALAYVFYLKRKLLVDVLGLAALHTLRILAGNAATDINFSSWLLAFSMFFFFSMALVKRYSELRTNGDDTGLRGSGRGYQQGDLDILSQLGISSGCISAMIMALYIDSASVRDLYTHPEVLWLICPIILYVIARIWVLAHRNEMPDDPIVFIMSDWRSHLMGAVVVGLMVIAAL